MTLLSHLVPQIHRSSFTVTHTIELRQLSSEQSVHEVDALARVATLSDDDGALLRAVELTGPGRVVLGRAATFTRPRARR